MAPISIRIIAVPPCPAPDHIREQWVGLIIPLAGQQGFDKNWPSDVRWGNSNLGGYEVTACSAVQALLDAGKEEAAQFWRRYEGNYLVFSRGVCELVSETKQLE